MTTLRIEAAEFYINQSYTYVREMIMNITQEQKDLAVKDGYTEIQDGVYLQTREFCECEQRQQYDYDDSGEIDFSTSEFWIITDNGIVEAA